MRTTITIAEDLLQEARHATGKDGYSEAIVTSIREYLALRKRLAFLDHLYTNKLPHAFSDIKRSRQKKRWSS